MSGTCAPSEGMIVTLGTARRRARVGARPIRSRWGIVQSMSGVPVNVAGRSSQMTAVNAPSLVAWKLFCLYTILLILLPSGAVFGVNFKVAVFVPLTFYALSALAGQTTGLLQCAFASFVLCASTAWLLPSLLNPFYAGTALSQYKDVLTTFAGCLFIRLFTPRMSDKEQFVKLCVYTVAFGSALKVVLLVYSLATGTATVDILEKLSRAFGVTLMSIELGDLGGRLQFPSDNLLPICLLVVTGLRKRLSIGRLSGVVICALLSISVIYTFSRFIWISAALAMLLGMLVSKRDKMNLVYLASFAAVVLYSFSLIADLIALRFSDALAGSSDAERTWQIKALTDFFWQAPLFGNGLGSYALQLKRSIELPYAYEVQILALLGQLGIVGTGCLVLLLFNYYRKAFTFQSKTRFFQFALLIVLCNFLASGFFNPSLLVSMSAVSYGFVFTLASINRHKEAACAAPEANNTISTKLAPSGAST